MVQCCLYNYLNEYLEFSLIISDILYNTTYDYMLDLFFFNNKDAAVLIKEVI